jgi:hypothetical protein
VHFHGKLEYVVETTNVMLAAILRGMPRVLSPSNVPFALRLRLVHIIAPDISIVTISIHCLNLSFQQATETYIPCLLTSTA